MTGHYLGEFSISYKPVKHGRPGIGATHSSRFIPLRLEGNHALDVVDRSKWSVVGLHVRSIRIKYDVT